MLILMLIFVGLMSTFDDIVLPYMTSSKEVSLVYSALS